MACEESDYVCLDLHWKYSRGRKAEDTSRKSFNVGLFSQKMPMSKILIHVPFVISWNQTSQHASSQEHNKEVS